MKVLDEALVGLFEQFGGCLQVDLGGGDVDVAEVGSERGQLRIDILALAIPGEQPGAGEAVTQLVQPGSGAALSAA